MKKIITLVLLISLLSVSAFAQEARITVKENKARIENKSIVFEMEITIEGFQVGRYESMNFIPILKGKNEIKALPEIILNGSNKDKMHKRTIVLRGQEVATADAYTVMKNDPKQRRVINYSVAIPFENWMERCDLILYGEHQNYDGYPYYVTEDVLTRYQFVVRK